jgi:lysophospholipase L1-like esterase
VTLPGLWRSSIREVIFPEVIRGNDMRNHLTRLSITIAALLLSACNSSRTSSDTPPRNTTQPTSAPTIAAPTSKWENDILAFEAADRVSPPPKGAILFIGSSTIRMWESLASDYPDYQVINRGFGGSELADSVQFADRIVIPYQPRLIVLNAGTNDISNGKAPQQILEDFDAFVKKVRSALPNTRIAYLAIQPCPARWPLSAEQMVANKLIAAYVARGQNLDYIEVWKQYLGPDGKPDPKYYLPDGIHGNADGYKIRADVVRPHLAEAANR